MAIVYKKLFGLTKKTTVDDNDVMAGKDSTVITGDPDKNWLMSTLKTYFQNFVDGLKLSPGRIAFQELTSGSLSVSGWYTIAELPSGGQYKAMGAEFECAYLQSLLSFKVNLANRGGAGGEVRSIEVTGYSGNTRGSFSSAYNTRLAKSDSVATSGAKIQVYIDATSSGNLYSQMSKNISSSTSDTDNIVLVSPYLDDTPTLPDGVTVGTFLEAGAEFIIPVFGTIPGTLRRNGDTQIIFTIPWAQLPKLGSSVAFDFVNSGLTIRDGAGTAISLPETDFTLSAPIFRGELVYFVYTATVGTPFSGLNDGPLMASIVVADMTITIE